MKVLQIVTQMEAAGAQKVAHLIHEQLVDRGYDSQLLFLYTKRPAYEGLPGVMSLMDHQPKRFDYVTIVGRLVRTLRAMAPDVVITHTHYANVLGHAASLLAGVEQRIAVHHNPLPTYPWSARVVDSVMGSVGVYSQMVAVSEAVVATMQRYPRTYRRLVTRVYNGLPLGAETRAFDVRARWNVPSDAPLLLHVGRMSKQKNHATLLDAMRLLSGVHLILVGDGELRESVEARVRSLGLESRVHMTGEITSGEVNTLLRSTDAFVFPSLWEAMPLAALEALQAGATIVGGDIPALRELLDDAAILVPPTDAAALAAGVRRVLGDAALRRQLSATAVERARRYTVENMVEAYERLMMDGARH